MNKIVRTKLIFVILISCFTFFGIINYAFAANDITKLSEPLLVAVGSNALILTSANKGLSWVKQKAPIPSDADLYTVIWTGHQYLALGGSQKQWTVTGWAFLALTSPDGIRWASHIIKVQNMFPLHTVAYNGTSLYVASGSGNGIFISSDGIKWTAIPQNVNDYWPMQIDEIHWDGDRFLAVGYIYYNGLPHGLIMSSIDGTHWNRVQFPGLENLGEIAYLAWATNGLNMFQYIITAGDYSSSGMNMVAGISEDDGRTWLLQSCDPESCGFGGPIIWNPNTKNYVSPGTNNALNFLASVSKDGKVWAISNMLDKQIFASSITYSGDNFITVGNYYQPFPDMPLVATILISLDGGINWKEVLTEKNYKLYAVT